MAATCRAGVRRACVSTVCAISGGTTAERLLDPPHDRDGRRRPVLVRLADLPHGLDLIAVRFAAVTA
jgi:hypothetical protein